MKFPDLLERFISYTRIDTGSKEDSETFPSTYGQRILAEKLKCELLETGLSEVYINDSGYVFATLKTNQVESGPVLALIAHLDTSPDVSGYEVKPQVHRNYDGNDIILSNKSGCILKMIENPSLKDKIGKTIITTDGNTLLGADDKAGIAEIMSAVTYLAAHPELPRPMSAFSSHLMRRSGKERIG
jgi:tripeptide aminopeptidase